MIRNIVRDPLFLAEKASAASREDLKSGKDLLDTLNAHPESVGMAANMIGVNKKIIAVDTGGLKILMFNPRIIQKSGPYDVKEGCLSLSGMRSVRRYKKIVLEYQDILFRKHRESFSNLTAEIIQHECDHLNGILI